MIDADGSVVSTTSPAAACKGTAMEGTAKLDAFSYHEVMDRAHTIYCMIEELLTDHPALEAHEELMRHYVELWVAAGAMHKAALLRAALESCERHREDFGVALVGDEFCMECCGLVSDHKHAAAAATLDSGAAS